MVLSAKLKSNVQTNSQDRDMQLYCYSWFFRCLRKICYHNTNHGLLIQIKVYKDFKPMIVAYAFETMHTYFVKPDIILNFQ